MRMFKCYIWPVLLYGVETCSLKIKSINWLEACEVWILRKILQISRTEKVSNLEVLRRAGVEMEMLYIVKMCKAAYSGHVLIGRKQHLWMRNLHQWTGISHAQTIFHLAEGGHLCGELKYNCE